MRRHPPRVERQFGAARRLLVIGLPRGWWRDAYHTLLTMTWRRFFALLLGGYLLLNGAFALGYLSLGDAIENARAGSFADAFFFSVQTLATIGYGRMAPRTVGANFLVSAEALVGVIGLAVTTGLVYARFSRPTARVLFSRVATVRPWEGVPSLLFRVANTRGNQIAEARIKVVLLRDETTPEGEWVRRVRDLRLLRDESATFALTWTVVHPITVESPLFGATPESLRAARADIIASLTGHDDGLAQVIHARNAWRADEIAWNVRFADVLSTQPDGSGVLDYRRFHDVEPLGEPAGQGDVARVPARPAARPGASGASGTS